MKKVLVLGSTGSIGSSTLDIIRNMKDDFCVCGITAHSNEEKLLSLKNEFNCLSLLTKNAQKNDLSDFIDKTKPDIVVNGIAGSAGLLPSKLVLEKGINLALANKETVVMAWNLIDSLSKKNNAKIIPVDSEHSAIFSLINQCGKENIDSVVITASGGPFSEYTKEQLKNVQVEDALKHPTWNMGKKITIDSATLANKGLEVIEAVRLFNLKAEKVEVTVHPQSLVHSLVRTKDGMLYAQISEPDMKHPIYNALTYPEIKKTYLAPFSLFGTEMTFFKPKTELFPLLLYAFECAKKAASYTIAFNAANEVAVDAFLNKRIGFTQIAEVVNRVLQEDWSKEPNSFEEVFFADSASRKKAQEQVENLL